MMKSPTDALALNMAAHASMLPTSQGNTNGGR